MALRFAALSQPPLAGFVPQFGLMLSDVRECQVDLDGHGVAPVGVDDLVVVSSTLVVRRREGHREDAYEAVQLRPYRDRKWQRAG